MPYLPNATVLARSAICPLYPVAPYEFARESLTSASDRRGMHSHTSRHRRIHIHVRIVYFGRPNRRKEPRRIGCSRSGLSIQVAVCNSPFPRLANRGSSRLLFSPSFRPRFHSFSSGTSLQFMDCFSGRRRDREDREGRLDKSLVVKRAEIAAAPELRAGVRSFGLTRVRIAHYFPPIERVFLSLRRSERERIFVLRGVKFLFERVIFRDDGNFHKTEMEFKIRGKEKSEFGSWQVRLVRGLNGAR